MPSNYGHPVNVTMLTPAARYKQTHPVEFSYGSATGSNYQICILTAPTTKKLCIEEIRHTAIIATDEVTGTAGTISFGVSDGVSALNATNVMAATKMYNSPFNTAYASGSWTPANFASTLKSTSLNPDLAGKPIVPAGGSLWATVVKGTGLATSGDVSITVYYYEVDD